MDEYLRNAIHYTLEILCDRNPLFVRFRYHVTEIGYLLELLMHSFFIIKKNASFSEYFYSYTRNDITARRKILSIIGLLIHPYLQAKIRKMEGQSKLKRLLTVTDGLFQLWDFGMKSTYLLNDQQYYSPYY